jgi:PTS system mannose-specific IIA component
MIGILLVAHGRLSEEFLSVVLHITGPQKNILSFNVNPGDEPNACRQDLLNSAQNLNSGHGVIILTDLFGGTPSNLALSIMGECTNTEVIAGMNLPMLIKILDMRMHYSLEAVLREAQDCGRKYISVASQLLPTSSSL